MKMFPAVREAIKLAKEGHIGSVKSLSANSGFYPGKYNVRHTDPKLWGGALTDMGCYTLHLAAALFGTQDPVDMKVTSVPMETGVDESTAITLKFEGGKLANLYATLGHKLPCNAVIGGTKGYVTIVDPFWSSEAIQTSDGLREFPLPPKNSFPEKMKHPNSEGMVYEIEEVYRCLLSGKKESELSSHKESLFVASLVEKVWKEIGYKSE